MKITVLKPYNPHNFRKSYLHAKLKSTSCIFSRMQKVEEDALPELKETKKEFKPKIILRKGVVWIYIKNPLHL